MLRKSQPESIHSHTTPGDTRPPDLNSLVANPVVVEVKKFDRPVDAQGIGQDLEKM